MFRRLLTLVTVVLLLPACSHLPKWVPRWRKKPRAAAVAVAQPVDIGKITLVNAEERFVLIDHEARPAPESGVILKSVSGGVETGELQATNVHRRPFTIADIKSGAPQKGDRVLLMPFLEVKPAATPESRAQTY